MVGISQHLEKLEAFAVIARVGKINDASKIINLSQPSLTRLINTLEAAVGVKLFNRSRSGSNLTPAGQELYAYSQIVLNPIKDLEIRLKNPNDMKSGHLRIGSYESLAEYLWPDFLKMMKTKYKKLNISIKTSYSEAHLHSLKSGGIDLLIDAEPRVKGDVDSYPLYGDNFSFYINKKIKDKRQDKISNLPIILVPTAFDEKNKSLAAYMSGFGFDQRDKIELDSFTTVRTFCEKGLGLGLLPRRLAEPLLISGKLSNVSLSGVPKKFGKHTIFATIRSDRFDDPRIKTLIRELKLCFK